MDIRKLQRAIVDGLEDVKAQNIVVFNTEHLSALFERVIIASGTSNRQTKALASSVMETVKGRGMQVLRTEGADNGEWIIVDCGAAVAHIMQPAIRDYYHLEEIWGDKPVRLKAGAAGATATARKGAGKAVSAGGRAQAFAPGRDTPDAPVKKPAARKVAAKTPGAARPAPGRTSSPKSGGGARSAARPAAASKPAAGKAAPKKTTARKTAAGNSTGRKSVARPAAPSAGSAGRKRRG